MKRIFSVILTLAMLATTAAATVSFSSNATETSENPNPNTPQSAIQAMRNSLTMTFHDEFDGDEIDKTKWGYEYDLNGGTRNGEPQLYTSSDKTHNAYVEDGNLIIESRRVTKDEVWYNADGTKQEAKQDADGNYYVLGNDGKSKYYFTSASLRNYLAEYPGIETGSEEYFKKLYSENGCKYGMIEARIKFPDNDETMNETWGAFWSVGGSETGIDGVDKYWPRNDWPNQGEIDIAELFSKQYSMNQIIHYSPNLGGKSDHTTDLVGGYNPKGNTAIRGSYHTYGIYYTDKIFMYYVDDCITALYDISAKKYDFFRKNPQFVFLNMAIGNMNSYGFGANAVEDFVKSYMKIDYVREYQALDGDYSHIKVLNAYDDTQSNIKVYQGSYWEPGGRNQPLSTGKGDLSFSLTTKNKFAADKYDVYVTGTKAWWTVGAFDESIAGSTYKVNADYTVASIDEKGNTYMDDLSTYIGTADIQNGEHNLKINFEATTPPKDIVGSLVRSIVLVGKSKNEPTVTVSDDAEITTTTAAPTSSTSDGTTAQQPTTVSSETVPIYDNFYFFYGSNGLFNDLGQWENSDKGLVFSDRNSHGFAISDTKDVQLYGRSKMQYIAGQSIPSFNYNAYTAEQQYLESGKYKLIALQYVDASAGKFSFDAYEIAKSANSVSGDVSVLNTVDFTNNEPCAVFSNNKIKAFDLGEFELKDGVNNKIGVRISKVESSVNLKLVGIAAVPVNDGEQTTSVTEQTATTTTVEPTTATTTAPTTTEPITEQPTTAGPTVAPTTEAPTTTTIASTTTTTTVTTTTTTTTTAITTTTTTTVAPTTAEPTTEQPTTAGPTAIVTTTSIATSTDAPTTTATATSTVTSTAEPTTTVAPTTTEPPFTYGDANGDNKITATDVLLIRKNIAGQDIVLIFKAADVNNDGKLTATDVLMIRKFIAGQPVVFG